MAPAGFRTIFTVPLAGLDTSAISSLTTTPIATSTNTTRAMINADTGKQTVLPTRRRRWLWWTLGSIGAVIGIATGVAALYEVPMYTVSPGSVWPTEDLITVQGADSFESAGQIGFTTVSLSSQRTSALEAFFGWLDPAVDVLDEELILGDQTPDENRARQQQFMNDSKLQATAVALETLGYDAAETVGAVALDVDPALPAAEILEVGDIIVEADGEPITNWDDLVEAIGVHKSGDEITLGIVPFDAAMDRCGPDAEHEGDETPEDAPEDAPVADCDPTDVPADAVEQRTATLTEIDDDPNDDVPPRPLLGIVGEDVVIFHFPFRVDIDSGEVGGPSAGLAFTLSVLDVLTPEDLTGGNQVATTGTINMDGTVGPVGGVYQKIITARRAGVEVFIVPSEEYDEALTAAGDGMRIEKADTVEEALAVLATVGGDTSALQEGFETAFGG